jgi:hypothetical protein
VAQHPYGPGAPARLALELIAHTWALLVLQTFHGQHGARTGTVTLC